MEIVVKEILNWQHSDWKDKLVEIHIIKDEKLEDCFKRVYAMKRSGRYDSARRYEFADKSVEEKYWDWKEKNETIEMFYASVTVD